ncbi:MAG TPA: DNA polymerase III subunit alpha, partial [Nitriliruptorales bacterium]|nr:DNA polymerase III subunit alpha [Nitriliruptorales bacterium]
ADRASSRPDAGDTTHDPRVARPARGPAWLEDDAARVILLARNQAGYGSLCRATSAAHRAVRSSPHVTWEDLTTRPDGLYAVLGMDSPVGRLVAAGRMLAAEREARRWLEAFTPDQVLIGVRHHLAEGDDRRAGRMVALADRLGVTAVAVNDVRYLEAADAYLADVLTCVRAQVPVAGHHVGRRTAEGWFKAARDLLRIPLFRDRPDLLANAQRVAESCTVDLGLHAQPHAPRLTGLSEQEAARELHVRCWVGLHERYDRLTPEHTDRLRRELVMVDHLGLHDYFLTVADIVAGIRDMGVLTACRGSAAGSLICHLLRISDVDPVANGLVFERFMNPYRDELPDIDIDVESARREDVYRMIIGRYGDERTACVAMVETFQAASAVREVGKVLGLPPDEIDLVAKGFRNVRARDVRRAIEQLPELRGSRLDAGQLEMLLQVVERIDGFPRHLALHPCGIVLADTHLCDRTPVERSAGSGGAGPTGDGFSMTQFDKDDVAAMGLLKLDVLAVRLLSSMRYALDLLPETRGETVDFHAIPDEDPTVYELLRTSRSVGVFQVESPGQRELLGRLRPDRFGDLLVEISLFRPGPVKADMVGPYVARRQGEEAADYLHPMLEPVLGETFGVVVYHEQVMGVIATLTGCDLATADLVRRELADDAKLAERRPWALQHAAERGLDRATAEAVWHQVESFASFGFCKAHAAAFAVPTYRSAWLKVHHLPELVAGLLTHDPGMYPRRLLLEEARQFGIAVLPPDVNVSLAAYTVERIPADEAYARLEVRPGEVLPPGWSAPDRGRPVPPAGEDKGDAGTGRDGRPLRWAVRIGLQDVKGMSDAERATLVAGRPYGSLADLRTRGGISRPTAENLCKAGALDRLLPGGDRRAGLLAVEEQWGRAQRRTTGPDPQTALALYADHRPRLPSPSDADLVRDELEVLGLDVSRHVIAFYEPLLEVLGVTRAHALEGEGVAAGRPMRVAGVRVALQSPPVRSGQRVLFLSLDDRTGTTQCNFFQSVLDRNAWTVLHAWLVVVEGRLDRREAAGGRTGGGTGAATGGAGRRGGATVVAERAWDLTRLWRAWGAGRLDEEMRRSGPPPPHERRPADPAGLAAAMFASGSRR